MNRISFGTLAVCAVALAGCGGSSTTVSGGSAENYDVWGEEGRNALPEKFQAVFTAFEDLNEASPTAANPSSETAVFASFWESGRGGVLFQVGSTTYVGDLSLLYVGGQIGGDINTIAVDDQDGTYTYSTGTIDIAADTMFAGQFSNAGISGNGDFTGLNGSMDGIIKDDGLDASLLVVFDGSMSGEDVNGIGTAGCVGC